MNSFGVLTQGKIRFIVFLLLVVSLVGTLVELALLEHYEEPLQRIPIFLIDIAILVIIWYRFTLSSKWSGGFFAGTMAAFIPVGLVGLVLHYRSNVEFALERQPDLSEFSLFGEALGGAMPVLAPGMMIYTGSLGLIYYFLIKTRSES